MGQSSVKSASAAKDPTARVPPRKVPDVTEEPQSTRGTSVLVRRRDNPGYLPNLTAEQQQRSADPTDWTNPAL